MVSGLDSKTGFLGITSISVTPDAIDQTKNLIYQAEKKTDSMPKIVKTQAVGKFLDSRGNPTIETEVFLDTGIKEPPVFLRCFFR